MKLLRDERPHFISFADDSIKAIQDLVNLQDSDWAEHKKFQHQRLNEDLAKQLIALIPLHEELSLRTDRVSMFITPPRTYYRAHKDGRGEHAVQVGVNYPLRIVDDRSITRWYSEEDMTVYEIDTTRGNGRDAMRFNPLRQEPTCSFTMKPTEAVLLNVDKWHDFHNYSNEHRVILTFRSADQGLTFDNAAKLFIEEDK